MISDNIINFLHSLNFINKLPDEVSIMNPYVEFKSARMSEMFYQKYYNDNKERTIILGINPGRFGAGVTGIPFTDTKRLVSVCGIPYHGPVTHEPSSVFVYDVIERFGGPEAFYGKFFFGAVCPLGFTSKTKNGREINYNYYDSKELIEVSREFILENLKRQIEIGINTDYAFCLGTGKNFKHLAEINNRNGFFKTIIPLEHPRYIMQYKHKSKEEYIEKFLSSFEGL